MGKIMSVSARENTVVVHKYGPVSDGHLRLHWQPLYWEDGVQVFGSGSKPAEETVEIKRVLEPIQLHDGGISHAAARRLENRGYSFEEQVAAYHPESIEAAPEDEILAGAVKRLQERTCNVPLRSSAGAACAEEGPPKIRSLDYLEISNSSEKSKVAPVLQRRGWTVETKGPPDGWDLNSHLGRSEAAKYLLDQVQVEYILVRLDTLFRRGPAKESLQFVANPFAARARVRVWDCWQRICIRTERTSWTCLV